MSGKQNNNNNIANNYKLIAGNKVDNKSDETFINPLFPNQVLKKVNGKMMVVAYRMTKTKQKISNKKSN